MEKVKRQSEERKKHKTKKKDIKTLKSALGEQNARRGTRNC